SAPDPVAPRHSPPRAATARPLLGCHLISGSTEDGTTLFGTQTLNLGPYARMPLMARDGLLLLAAGTLCAGLLCAVPAAAQDGPASITVTLAVQTALQQGREALLHGNSAQAVQVLEAQL